jgi:hypothetical protein
MGNSRWRLETTLNYAAARVHELSRENEVEILMADWGSEIPLRQVLQLTPEAGKLVSFIEVPVDIARDLQKDSPFPEVLALNAAARRASGEYIGRIDQDILLGRHFLETFFDIHYGRRSLDVPLESALMFANQHMVPYRFCVRCPSLWAMEKYIEWFGHSLKKELSKTRPFYKFGVGIWLAHRDLWNACGGYDERMIYMNAMEINMIERLKQTNELVDLGKLVDYDFYHLEHYHPLAIRSSATHRNINSDNLFSQPDSYNPNGPDWGLVQYPFKKVPYTLDIKNVELHANDASPLLWLNFISLIILSGVQIAADILAKPFWIRYVGWKRRLQIAWGTVHSQPLIKWPQLLIALWVSKKEAKAGKAQEPAMRLTQ